ncbi:MAG TPA: MFS transporter [Acidimicrobiales bacterium]|nr:MFS transporter [Acidimicrobiales bacterium]
MPSTRRSVIALLASVFCASAASMAGVTVIGKQVYDLTRSELALGFLGLAEFAPAFLLVLLTGAIADRFERRRVAAVGIAFEVLTSLGLAAYAATKPTSATPIFGLVLVFGIARAFVAPATRALPADIVPADRLPWLMPRQSATWQIALILGPVIGGFLYTVDPSAPYIFMAVMLLLSAIAVSVVQVRPVREHEPAIVVSDPLQEAAVEGAAAPVERGVASGRAHLSEALEGLRFIRRDQILFGAISLDLFAVLFGGAVALLPAIAEERLGVGAVGLGWLRAAGGIGAGLVTLRLAFRPIQRLVGKKLLLAVAVFGLGTLALGVTRNFAVAFVALAVLSGADAISVFIRSTLVPLVTPNHMRGRVLAVENVFIGASNELGAFESGVAGAILGPAGAVVLGGGATLVVAGIWAKVFPALRDVERFPGSVNEPGPVVNPG